MTPASLPVRDLLDSGGCSPACLLAREPNGVCTCRCGGRFHAALVEAVTPESSGARPSARSAATADLKMAYESTGITWHLIRDHLSPDERHEFEKHIIEVRAVIAEAALRYPGGAEALGWESA